MTDILDHFREADRVLALALETMRGEIPDPALREQHMERIFEDYWEHVKLIAEDLLHPQSFHD